MSTSLFVLAVTRLAETDRDATTPSLLLVGGLCAVVYTVSCFLWPWKRCMLCQDRKKFYSPLAATRIFRVCPRCHGRGKEYRWGTRLIRGIFGFGFDRHN